MSYWSRGGYLAVSGALAGVSTAAALALVGDAAGSMAAGIATAWLLQAASYWWLVGALASGRRVLKVWIGGMAVRLGGLAVLAVAGASPALDRVALVLGYGVALLALLILEAGWLWRWSRGTGPEGPGGPSGTGRGSRSGDRAGSGRSG